MFGFGCCRSREPSSTSSSVWSKAPDPTENDQREVLPNRKTMTELRSGKEDRTWWQDEIIADKRNNEAEFLERDKRKRMARMALQEERERRIREVVQTLVQAAPPWETNAHFVCRRWRRQLKSTMNPECDRERFKILLDFCSKPHLLKSPEIAHQVSGGN